MTEDIVAFTEGITAEDLVLAYDNGIFPWPVDDFELVPWFCPQKRGVLFFKDFHLSRSDQKLFKNQSFEVSFNKDFSEILQQCAEVKRKGQRGTWITPDIQQAYGELFNQGKAYSVAVYKEGLLVGGMYGVKAQTYLSGESMFFKESGASKFALWSLVQHLEKEGLSFIDTQMLSPLLKRMGGRELDQSDFLNLIKNAKIIDGNLF